MGYVQKCNFVLNSLACKVWIAKCNMSTSVTPKEVLAEKNHGPWVSVMWTSLDLTIANGDLYRRWKGTIQKYL